MRPLAIVSLLALSFSSAVNARTEFATYEGADAVQTGTGGAKISKNGIDWWTSGTPPRRFQVIGIITDARSDKLLSGHAIGSSGLAKQVLTAGGNAAIVSDQDERPSGSVGFANGSAFGNSFSAFGYRRIVNRVSTRLIVIKYLDAGADQK